VSMRDLRNALAADANAVTARHVVRRTGTWTINERAGTVRDEFGDLVVYIKPSWWRENEESA